MLAEAGECVSVARPGRGAASRGAAARLLFAASLRCAGAVQGQLGGGVRCAAELTRQLEDDRASASSSGDVWTLGVRDGYG